MWNTIVAVLLFIGLYISLEHEERLLKNKKEVDKNERS